MRKLNSKELLGLTIWVSFTLIATIMVFMYILPDDYFTKNSIAHEIYEYRGFFKRFSTLIMILAIPLSASYTFFEMLMRETDPSDFCNFQDKSTKFRNVNMKENIESIEEVYEIPINVVNNLLFRDAGHGKDY